MTNRPPSSRMVSVARLVANMMTGMRPAKSRRMLRLMSRACVLAAANFTASYCCELSRRMSPAPRMLSLMTLFSQSMASCAFLNSFRTFPRTTAKVTPMIGSMARTPIASFQLIDSNNALAPRIKKTEEIRDAIA